jgi:hypothetical protein
MKWKRTLFAGALLGAFAVGVVWAQVQNDISGNELWEVGQGAGGPGNYISVNQVRNSAAKVAISPTTVLTYGTSPLAALNFGGNILMAAQPGASPTTITTPPNPVADGTTIGYCNVTGSAFATTPVTIAASTSQTLNTGLTTTTLAAVTCVRYQFNRANTTWYRIQ